MKFTICSESRTSPRIPEEHTTCLYLVPGRRRLTQSKPSAKDKDKEGVERRKEKQKKAKGQCWCKRQPDQAQARLCNQPVDFVEAPCTLDTAEKQQHSLAPASVYSGFSCAQEKATGAWPCLWVNYNI